VVAVEYVMVPVPEELAGKVLTYVSWKDAQATATPPEGESADAGDDGDAIARALARFDDASRALVAVAAAAALEEEELSIPKAARRADVSTREALGILMEVNNIIADEGGPPIGFARKDEGGTSGEFAWDAHIIVMSEALARTIADLAPARASG